MAEGTPEELAAHPDSATGPWLREAAAAKGPVRPRGSKKKKASKTSKAGKKKKTTGRRADKKVTS